MWSAGIAMRFRSIQAGPLMQMPVFLLLFFAPVYVPLDLLSGAMHAVAVLNPITYVLEAGRSLISGQPEEVALAFALAAALAGALVALGLPRAAAGRSRGLTAARRSRRARRYGAPVSRTTWPGRPFPLGPTWDGNGTNFSLFSENAERRRALPVRRARTARSASRSRQRTAHNWHVYLPGVGPGQRYGYRVDGPWEPTAGHRFNPAKLLIDPYAKAIEGPIGFGRARVLAYAPGEEDVPDARGLRAGDPALRRDRRRRSTGRATRRSAGPGPRR